MAVPILGNRVEVEAGAFTREPGAAGNISEVGGRRF